MDDLTYVSSNTLNGQSIPEKKSLRFNPGYDPLGPVEQTPFCRPLTHLESTAIRYYQAVLDSGEPFPERTSDCLAPLREVLGENRPIDLETLEGSFKNLFKLYPDIKFLTAVKRITGHSIKFYTKEECKYALEWVIDSNSEQLHNGRAKWFVPTKKYMDQLFERRVMIPELGIPVPKGVTVTNIFGKDKIWSEIIFSIRPQLRHDIRRKLYVKTDIKDLVVDYRLAFGFFYGIVDNPTDQIVTKAMIDEYAAKGGGLGFSRYQLVMNEHMRNGKELSLNDIREKAGLPKNIERVIRRQAHRWDDWDVIFGFLAAWKTLGEDKDPPTGNQLQDLSSKQSDIINSYGTLDHKTAEQLGVPIIPVPSTQIIINHFGGVLEFYGVLENNFGRTISFKKPGRTARLATEAIKRDLDPKLTCKQVRDAIFERTETTRSRSR